MTKPKTKGGGYKKSYSRPRAKSGATHAACSKKRTVIKERVHALQNEVTHLQGELSTQRAIVEDLHQHVELLLSRSSKAGGPAGRKV